MNSESLNIDQLDNLLTEYEELCEKLPYLKYSILLEDDEDEYIDLIIVNRIKSLNYKYNELLEETD